MIEVLKDYLEDQEHEERMIAHAEDLHEVDWDNEPEDYWFDRD